MNRAVFLLSLAAFASAASLRATDPLLPLIAHQYGVSTGAASGAVTAFALSYGLLQIVVGPVGDRFGRYRTIAAAALVSAFGSAACRSIWTSPPTWPCSPRRFRTAIRWRPSSAAAR